MSAKKCAVCGKERCPGIVMRLDCPELALLPPLPLVSVTKPQPREQLLVTKPVTISVPIAQNKVTGGQNIVTNGQIIVTRRRGRPRLGAQPLTPAEKQKRYREKA